MTTHSIGENIKTIREDERHKMSQRKLAELTGLSVASIQGFEHGKFNPRYDTVCKIAKALQVNPADIDESLAIDLGNDYIYVDSAGESHTFSTDMIEFRLLSAFDTLTDSAKDQAVQLIETLASFPENRNDGGRGLEKEEE